MSDDKKTPTELWTALIQRLALIALLALLLLAFGWDWHIPTPLHEGVVWGVLAALGIPRVTEVMRR